MSACFAPFTLSDRFRFDLDPLEFDLLGRELLLCQSCEFFLTL